MDMGMDTRSMMDDGRPTVTIMTIKEVIESAKVFCVIRKRQLGLVNIVSPQETDPLSSTLDKIP